MKEYIVHIPYRTQVSTCVKAENETKAKSKAIGKLNQRQKDGNPDFTGQLIESAEINNCGEILVGDIEKIEAAGHTLHRPRGE